MLAHKCTHLKSSLCPSNRNSPRQSANAETFPRHIYVFQYLPRQKNAEAINFLGIFKKDMLPKIKKVYFCLKKKRNVSLNKKVIFVFHTIYTISSISVSGKRNIETMLTLLYSYNWQKFNKINEKRSQEYQSMGPECVTRQINSRILEIILSIQFDFFYPLENLNTLQFDKAFSQRLQNSSQIQMSILH